MQPGVRTESEVDVRQIVVPPAEVPTSDPAPGESSTQPDPVVSPQKSGTAAGTHDDFLLGTPAAGRVVTGALVAGVAAAVGIVLVSVVAMLVTAVVGALVAYVVAHDDEWLRAVRRRRVRRRPILVAPRWTRHSWGGGHGVGRHAAT